MVKSATSLTRNGVRDWIIQRISAVIIGLYVIFLAGFILLNPHLTYDAWYQLFCHPVMRIFTILTLIAIMGHAYIGLWTIVTDYLTRSTWLRMSFLILVWLALIVFLVWGIMILSGL